MPREPVSGFFTPRTKSAATTSACAGLASRILLIASNSLAWGVGDPGLIQRELVVTAHARSSSAAKVEGKEQDAINLRHPPEAPYAKSGGFSLPCLAFRVSGWEQA